MELWPALSLGWLNGWLLLAGFYMVFGVLLLVYPREVVARLYAFPRLSGRRMAVWMAGRAFNLGCLALIVLTPLKLSQGVFVVGSAAFALGFAVMMVALHDYRTTPLGQPVTKGLYRLSRNPQWLGLAVMFLGTCIAIGSWAAVILLLVMVGFYHLRLLGEEDALLQQYGEAYREYMRRVPRYFVFF
ncbi:MAG TPA: isoprenylcysteine carboxylmethyltransferase family protein [Anaerolineae bacterium]|nr:isoprenylcysteine carboxylmethyltransferase family protein [Anaerolineae bacterium]HOQ98632.1 isoprenylcysteine carboxylmethyltransferase family protein [Anaerolineae bacterium]HPL28245.1 isoprenylcysteine carboxylmethyltransferase family protein [Anaerolineae bacterium]